MDNSELPQSDKFACIWCGRESDGIEPICNCLDDPAEVFDEFQKIKRTLEQRIAGLNAEIEELRAKIKGREL